MNGNWIGLVILLGVALLTEAQGKPSVRNEGKPMLTNCKGKRGLRACVLTPEETEGPYYYNAEKAPVRQNITEGLAGVPFTLYINVVDANTCESISGAVIDIWHCSSMGIYSHYVEASTGVQNPQTDNTTFLRGILFTNESGIGVVDTIYPGWYTGRTVHMHIKVHIGGTVTNNVYSGGSVVHTGQLFTNDSLTDQVSLVSPYSENTNERTLLADDDIYTNTGGSYTLLEVQLINSSLGVAGGLEAYITLGVSTTTSSPTTATTSSTTTAPTTSATSSPTTSTTTSPTTSTTTSPTTSTTSSPTSSNASNKSALLTTLAIVPTVLMTAYGIASFF